MELRPVRLEPCFVPRIWGSRDLSPLFPEKSSLAEPIGEVWLTGNDCRFADGPFAGQTLGDAWPRMGEDWRGKAFAHSQRFPLLVKFLFPEDKLSVQVHPGDNYARTHETAAGGAGKTEMWYVISARPGAEVRVGLRETTTAGDFRRALADGRAEEHVTPIPVRAGDAIFVPAGTVHSIGPRMRLCEIQQNSDITYRVFDFGRVDAQGRPRALHIEKAFDVMHFGKQLGGKTQQTVRTIASGEMHTLAECEYFTVEKYEFSRRESVEKKSGQMEVAVILEGSGEMKLPRGVPAKYSRAQAWLVPAAAEAICFEPAGETELLRARVPFRDSQGGAR